MRGANLQFYLSSNDFANEHQGLEYQTVRHGQTLRVRVVAIQSTTFEQVCEAALKENSRFVVTDVLCFSYVSVLHL